MLNIPSVLVKPFADDFTPVDAGDWADGGLPDWDTTGGGIADEDVTLPDDLPSGNAPCGGGAGGDVTPPDDLPSESVTGGGANDGAADGDATPPGDIPAGSATGGGVSGGDAASNDSKITAPAGVTTKAAWDKCVIQTPPTAQAGIGFRIRIVGDRQDENGKYDSETKFVPSSWTIRGAPFGSYASEKPFTPPYESAVTLKNAGTYTITAKYKALTFMSGYGWTEDAIDFEYVKTATVSVPLTVYFNAGDGRARVLYSQYFLTQKCGVFPSPSRKNYRFAGWYRTPDGDAADLVRKKDRVAILNTSRESSVTLYAHYSKSVKVRFKANGGKVKKKSKRVTYVTAYDKKTYGKLPRPTRKGYHFAGWYTKKKGGRYVSAYSEVRSAKNITLYARWMR
jgi:uncharacterized repeat protein (TIGR02543 family)